MAMTMTAQQQQLVDPRFVVPLCIRENRLEDDYLLPPESPNMMATNNNNNNNNSKAGGHLAHVVEPEILASPTSIIEVIELLPHGGEGSQNNNYKESFIDTFGKENHGSSNGKKKKKKKSKPKLFRSKKRSAKDEAEKAKQEVLRRAALRMMQIQAEEDADFAALRQEEEESPKLDMLVHYPLTLMEEVLSIPIPEREDTDQEDSNDDEEEREVARQKEPEAEKIIDLGRFEADVHSLRVSQMDLRRFLSQPNKFAELQKELREGRCITDETLRQRMHVLCRSNESDSSRDIFSEIYGQRRGWSTQLPKAYRRMQVFPATVDWRVFAKADVDLSAILDGEIHSDDEYIHGGIKKKKSDRKLPSPVAKKSPRGKDPSIGDDEDDAEEEIDTEVYDKEMLQDGVDLLSYCARDVVPIVEDEDVFANLQHELRKIGAVTNEVLKQGLHFYVRDVRLQKERELAAATMQTSEEYNGVDVTSDPSLREVGGVKRRKPLLQKLRFRSNRKTCNNE